MLQYTVEAIVLTSKSSENTCGGALVHCDKPKNHRLSLGLTMLDMQVVMAHITISLYKMSAYTHRVIDESTSKQERGLPSS